MAALSGLAAIPPPATVERAEIAPAMGASQNSHSCSMAHPPANSAGPVLRAELTEVLVTGMLIGCISVCTSGAGRVREVFAIVPDFSSASSFACGMSALSGSSSKAPDSDGDNS